MGDKRGKKEKAKSEKQAILKKQAIKDVKKEKQDNQKSVK